MSERAETEDTRELKFRHTGRGAQDCRAPDREPDPTPLCVVGAASERIARRLRDYTGHQRFGCKVTIGYGTGHEGYLRELLWQQSEAQQKLSQQQSEEQRARAEQALQEAKAAVRHYLLCEVRNMQHDTGAKHFIVANLALEEFMASVAEELHVQLYGVAEQLAQKVADLWRSYGTEYKVGLFGASYDLASDSRLSQLLCAKGVLLCLPSDWETRIVTELLTSDFQRLDEVGGAAGAENLCLDAVRSLERQEVSGILFVSGGLGHLPLSPNWPGNHVSRFMASTDVSAMWVEAIRQFNPQAPPAT